MNIFLLLLICSVESGPKSSKKGKYNHHFVTRTRTISTTITPSISTSSTITHPIFPSTINDISYSNTSTHSITLPTTTTSTTRAYSSTFTKTSTIKLKKYNTNKSRDVSRKGSNNYLYILVIIPIAIVISAIYIKKKRKNENIYLEPRPIMAINNQAYIPGTDPVYEEAY